MIIKQTNIELQKLLSIVPTLTNKLKKGENGKFGVIGGSFEYTGAPYYAAISSLKAGADLSHVFCTKDAGIPIKSYSPELIVHPTLPNELDYYQIRDHFLKDMQFWMQSLHGFIIGPGLGRRNYLANVLVDLLELTADENQIFVIDADGIYYFLTNETLRKILLENKRNVFLTPNNGEFERLWNFFMKNQAKISESEKEKRKIELSTQNLTIFELDLNDPLAYDASELSKKLNNINIILKGEVDVITNGKAAFGVYEEGCLKRCGGQGDILAGVVMLYSFWAKLKNDLNFDLNQKILSGAVLASVVVRKAAKKAFQAKFIGVTAPDIIDHLIESFLDCIKDKN